MLAQLCDAPDVFSDLRDRLQRVMLVCPLNTVIEHRIHRFPWKDPVTILAAAVRIQQRRRDTAQGSSAPAAAPSNGEPAAAAVRTECGVQHVPAHVAAGRSTTAAQSGAA
mmetsp:Transcript_5279/g.15144  ORF Transcript_5279/g.15144 Transcript_5279/m.15144 type:complete len:110 (+) Transcript_5279:89-418(+)